MDRFDAGKEKALRDIEQFGCHVIHVLAEDNLPPFSYTVGIQQTSSAPELIVIGLKQGIAHFVLNEYNRRVREGERFGDGTVSSGFLEGFEGKFQSADRSHYEDYLSWDIWLYQGLSFETLQFVYPNTSGVWPWQQEADDWFRARQPILANPKCVPSKT